MQKTGLTMDEAKDLIKEPTLRGESSCGTCGFFRKGHYYSDSTKNFADFVFDSSLGNCCRFPETALKTKTHWCGEFSLEDKK